MGFVHPGPVSLGAFLAVNLLVVSSILYGLHYANRKITNPPSASPARVGAGVLVWLVANAIVAASGVVESVPMPSFPLYFLTTLTAGSLLALSNVGKKLALGLPIWALVLFQSFRLPLELVLHSWAEQGTVPFTMTWTGQNIDIATGITALALAPFAVKSRAAAWTANVIGFGLLINVGRVAAMSSPLPFGWGVTPPLLLAAYFPYNLILAVCAAGALAGHIVLFRALLLRPETALRTAPSVL